MWRDIIILIGVLHNSYNGSTNATSAAVSRDEATEATDPPDQYSRSLGHLSRPTSRDASCRVTVGLNVIRVDLNLEAFFMPRSRGQAGEPTSSRADRLPDICGRGGAIAHYVTLSSSVELKVDPPPYAVVPLNVPPNA